MESIHKQVTIKANLAVAQFQGRANGLLDYTPSSLKKIEEMLEEASQYINQMQKKEIESLISLMGSYILEVASRQFTGVFYWEEQKNQPLFVTGEPKFHVAIMSFDKIRGRVNGDKADNIPFFYDGFEKRVQSAETGIRVLYI